MCVIGNGVVIHLPTLFEEIETLSKQGVEIEGRLLISDRAHLLFDLHKEIDGLREAELEGEVSSNLHYNRDNRCSHIAQLTCTPPYVGVSSACIVRC